MAAKLSQDARLHSTWLLKNAKYDSEAVSLLHYVCPHIFILYVILCSNVRDNNDNVQDNVTLVMNTERSKDMLQETLMILTSFCFKFIAVYMCQ